MSYKNGCAYCAGQRLCTDEDCGQCFAKSFASSERSAFWDADANAPLMPRDVFKCNNGKFDFKCEKGHPFAATLSHISSGTWCPMCASPKGEQELLRLLRQISPGATLGVQLHVSVPELGGCRVRRLDAVLLLHEHATLTMAFEVDGEQHFRLVTPYFRTSFSRQFKNDLFKTLACFRMGLSLLRWPRHMPFAIGALQQAVERCLKSSCISLPAGDACYRPLTIVLQYIGVISDVAEEDRADIVSFAGAHHPLAAQTGSPALKYRKV